MNIKLIACNRCGSIDTKFEKWIYGKRLGGETYHYKRICNDCGNRRMLKRCREIYEKVKTESWRYSHSYAKIRGDKKNFYEKEMKKLLNEI